MQMSPPLEDTLICCPESLSPKCIFICFEADSMRLYWLKSVPIANLFKSSQHDESVLERVSDYSWERSEGGRHAGIFFLPTKAADNIFYALYHGSVGDCEMIVPEQTLTMLKYSVSIENSIIKLHETPTKIMNSRLRHLMAIVVEIGGLIYVLSPDGIIDAENPEDPDDRFIFFQVYNPVEDEWRTLPPPPFLIDQNYKHIVVGNKFYISTIYLSAVFDTETKRWNSSPFSSTPPFDGDILESHTSLVACEDVLITITYPGLMRAYKVSELGEFEFMHDLWKEGVDELASADNGGCLYDLGDGHICIMSLTWTREDRYDYRNRDRPTIINFFLFKVSKSPDGKTLNCTVHPLYPVLNAVS